MPDRDPTPPIPPIQKQFHLIEESFLKRIFMKEQDITLDLNPHTPPPLKPILTV